MRPNSSAPSITKIVSILFFRLRTQGVRTTLHWLYGRVLPAFTGVPVIKYSRISPQVFVGSQHRALGKRRLESLGVTHCLNMRIEFDDAEHGLALDDYCNLPTVDDTEPTLEHLEKGVAFIRNALSNGGKVYIHCAGGVGRAPTMAAAYFVSTGTSLEDAVALIKKARPFVNVLPVQMDQLRSFEAGLKHKS